MSAYVVVSVDVHDPVKYEDYRKMVPATIARYGGQFVVRGAPLHEMEGTWLRQANSTADLVIVEGFDG